MEDFKPLLDTMSDEDKQNLVDFLTDMQSHPEFKKYNQIMYERFLIIQESCMAQKQEEPYLRGYAIGCRDSATFAKDYCKEITAEFKRQKEEAESGNKEEETETE